MSVADADPIDLANHINLMARWRDHDGEYEEPTPELPYDHCDATFCVRCGIEEMRMMLGRWCDAAKHPMPVEGGLCACGRFAGRKHEPWNEPDV